LSSLIYGGDFNRFWLRTVNYGHEEYGLKVLKGQCQYFGPFPVKYEEIAAPLTVQAIIWPMDEIPKSRMTRFEQATERGVCKKDKVSIGKMMKLDWRDRPTAKNLHEWFAEDE
jgi:hypothetical protein